MTTTSSSSIPISFPPPVPGAPIPPSAQHLLASTNAFFNALASNTSPIALLHHFSTSRLVSIQHAPEKCNNPAASRLTGPNAVRSYFDLIATHWTRSDTRIHAIHADALAKKVVTSASVTWMWKKSRRTWTEDFNCTLEFDDNFKIVSFTVCTLSAPHTCVMRAVDEAASSAAAADAAASAVAHGLAHGAMLTSSAATLARSQATSTKASHSLVIV